MLAQFDKANPVELLADELDAPDRAGRTPLAVSTGDQLLESWGRTPEALAGLAAATGAAP